MTKKVMMTKLKYLAFILILLIGACKLDDEQLPTTNDEQWLFALIDITEPILDIKVNEDELHLISNDYFYRVKEDEILEKRALETNAINENTTAPKIGNFIFYRVLIENNETFLEFQTTKSGGTPVRVSIADLSQGGAVFPNQISAFFNQPNVTVAFNQNDDFLFTGFEESNGVLQAFCSRIEFVLNAEMNQIDQVLIAERFDLEPGAVSGPTGFNNISVVENIFFLNFGTNGGTFRVEGSDITFDANSAIYSVLDESNKYVASERRNILESFDKGRNWNDTNDDLDLGIILRKEGDFYLEKSAENNQLFKFGTSIDNLRIFSLSFLNSLNAPDVRIAYFEEEYYLFMILEGAPTILKRSTLD